MAAGLHRIVSLGSSHRAAVNYVNELSSAFGPHVLSKVSLKRMDDSLPAPLRHPGTSSEGQLLLHIHVLQSKRRVDHTEGILLLTAVDGAVDSSRVQHELASNEE